MADDQRLDLPLGLHDVQLPAEDDEEVRGVVPLGEEDLAVLHRAPRTEARDSLEL